MRSRSHTERMRGDCSGNVAIISALMLPVLVGFAGLGFETASWYQRQRDLQAAADIAAYGAALVHSDGRPESDTVTSATADAAANGWRQADGTIAIHAQRVGRGGAIVEVILTEDQILLLSQIYLGRSALRITARSTAIARPVRTRAGISRSARLVR